MLFFRDFFMKTQERFEKRKMVNQNRRESNEWNPIYRLASELNEMNRLHLLSANKKHNNSKIKRMQRRSEERIQAKTQEIVNELTKTIGYSIYCDHCSMATASSFDGSFADQIVRYVHESFHSV